mmetsp:Transcript_84467/g.235621  ORF Transcript_84467/g.235621 Transcript_84467/m.235621 type:complete len:211 (-) Transcript_84467:264-896(-)
MPRLRQRRPSPSARCQHRRGSGARPGGKKGRASRAPARPGPTCLCRAARPARQGTSRSTGTGRAPRGRAPKSPGTLRAGRRQSPGRAAAARTRCGASFGASGSSWAPGTPASAPPRPRRCRCLRHVGPPPWIGRPHSCPCSHQRSCAQRLAPSSTPVEIPHLRSAGPGSKRLLGSARPVGTLRCLRFRPKAPNRSGGGAWRRRGTPAQRP